MKIKLNMMRKKCDGKMLGCTDFDVTPLWYLFNWVSPLFKMSFTRFCSSKPFILSILTLLAQGIRSIPEDLFLYVWRLDMTDRHIWTMPDSRSAQGSFVITSSLNCLNVFRELGKRDRVPTVWLPGPKIRVDWGQLVLKHKPRPLGISGFC